MPPPLITAFIDGHCINGHDITGEGAIYVKPSGQRRCRACKIAEKQRYRKRQHTVTRQPQRSTTTDRSPTP